MVSLESRGIRLRIMTYGAIIASLDVPDGAGNFGDVVLGFDNLESYVRESAPYFGAVIGRYANRIAGGEFELNGVRHQVTRNAGTSCLHGGANGFDKAVWKIESSEENSVRLIHDSPDGDEGFPGALRARVTYTLVDNRLTVDYEAMTTAPTVVNLTQHSYWNLAGAGRGDVLSHGLMVAASHYLPMNDTLIVTGEIRPVQETPFDFRAPTRIGDRIDLSDDQLHIGQGYDHNLVLDRADHDLIRAALLQDTASGRILEVFTTEPGVQLYTGNYLDGSIIGKNGAAYGRHAGLCLETQHFPNSPNMPYFPSTVLSPDETFRSRTVFAFSAI